MQPPAPTGSIPPIVLLVEDDPDTRAMYEAAFSLEGLWVAEATGADDALLYAGELRPDAIVTDISLDGQLEGLLLAERLSSSEKTADIPIIGVTGVEMERLDERRALFTELLLKPVPLDTLVRNVRSAIRSGAVQRLKGGHAESRSARLIERSARALKEAHEVAADASSGGEARGCPRCGEPLSWSDRRTIDGILFDYYHPCSRGCGLFCYDHAGRGFVTLIG